MYNKIFTRSLFCVQFILFRYQITNSQTLHIFDHIFYRHVKFSINQCGFMSTSDSSPFCAPVNKVKIISGAKINGQKDKQRHNIFQIFHMQRLLNICVTNDNVCSVSHNHDPKNTKGAISGAGNSNLLFLST